MIRYRPSRLYYGEDLHSLLRTDPVASRLGDRALLISDGDATTIIDAVRRDLSRAGVEAVLFGEVDENPRSESIERAARLAADGRALFAIGLGSAPVLSFGKAVCMAVADQGLSIYDAIDGGPSFLFHEHSSLPYVAIPTQLWNPLIFSDLAVLTDSRNATARSITTGVFADSVFYSLQFLKNLTEKQVAYDLLCILQSCAETYGCVGTAVDLPLLDATLEQAAAEVGKMALNDSLLDRDKAQMLGIRASFCGGVCAAEPGGAASGAPSGAPGGAGGADHRGADRPGPGAAVGWAAHSLLDIPAQWAAAAVLPATAAIAFERNGEALTGEFLNLPADAGVTEITDELRSLAAGADVPLRLRELGITSEQLSPIAAAAADISGFDSNQIREALETAF